MNQPVIHPRTLAALQRYHTKPTHGLILSGPPGAGKTTVAQWLIGQLQCEALLIEAAPDTKGIAIEQIRELYQITRSGAPLTLIIQDAQAMSREAQNAFLKLLEEPPANTRFILTVNRHQALLATIRSRSQHIEVLTPPAKEILSHATTLFGTPTSELQPLLKSVNELPGKFFDLLENKELRSVHLKKTEQAKQFYTAPSYQRHSMCVEAKFERNWSLELLSTLAIIVHTLIQTSSGNDARLKKLSEQAVILEDAAHSISTRNANVKIQLTKLIETL